MAKRISPQARRRCRGERDCREAHAAGQENDGQHRRPGRWRRRCGREAPRSARRYPVAHALERPLQPAQADSRDGQLRPTGGSSSTCRRPRPTCGRCSSPAAARSCSRRARRPACVVCTTCSSTRSKAPRKTPSTTRANATRSSKTSKCCSASLREELHLYADKRGEMVGNIILNDSGDEIDCSRMGSGGYAIPSIVEPEVIQLDPEEVRREVRAARRKRHRLAAVQRRQVLARSTAASSRTAPASRRAACAACSIGCTTN